MAEEPTFSEKLFGDVNPIIGSITGVLLIAVVISLLAWMRRMTVNQGSRSDYDWDEYSSEFEDDDEYEDEYEARWRTKRRLLQRQLRPQQRPPRKKPIG